jgi:hypothetical protein
MTWSPGHPRIIEPAGHDLVVVVGVHVGDDDRGVDDDHSPKPESARCSSALAARSVGVMSVDVV